MEVIPSASRLVNSLRDIGYAPTEAIADIVDNSIAAKAKNVWIELFFEGHDTKISIADDGHGMSKRELVEAMRFGTEKDYSDDLLGKFGLGLKTAALSQGKTLSVTSKRKGKNTVSYSWDLEHIQNTNEWSLTIPDKEFSFRRICPTLKSGTVVTISKLDRILSYKNPNGAFARKSVNRLCRHLELHLSMIFHRFIDGEKARKVKIYLNGNKLDSWDPFQRHEPKTINVEKNSFSLSGKKVSADGYVLPSKNQFSTEEAFNAASGPNGWNMQQAGGWSRLRTPDEHLKLARIALDFTPDLDEEFQVNVSKMKVAIPQDISNDLKSYCAKMAKEAEKRYRKSSESAGSQRTIQKKWSSYQIEAGILKLTSDNEKDRIKNLFDKFRELYEEK
jgi:hypothetical protein